jgi:hypothetical protein
VEEIAPTGAPARRLIPVMFGLSGLGLILLVLGLVRQGSLQGEAYPAVIFAMSAVGGVAILLWLRNARLVLGSGLIGQRDLLGRTKTHQVSDIGRLVAASVQYTSRTKAQPVLYVLSLDGRLLMSLPFQAWGDDAIGRAVRASGKTIEYREGVIPLKAFQAEFPGAVGVLARHGTLIGIGIALVVGALAFVLALRL